MCVVDLKTLTDFEWDTVYISSGIPRLENVISAIGMEYYSYEEFTGPIIFIKDHKIVYYELDIEFIKALQNIGSPQKSSIILPIGKEPVRFNINSEFIPKPKAKTGF
jgi:hypothetical protein